MVDADEDQHTGYFRCHTEKDIKLCPANSREDGDRCCSPMLVQLNSLGSREWNPILYASRWDLDLINLGRRREHIDPKDCPGDKGAVQTESAQKIERVSVRRGSQAPVHSDAIDAVQNLESPISTCRWVDVKGLLRLRNLPLKGELLLCRCSNDHCCSQIPRYYYVHVVGITSLGSDLWGTMTSEVCTRDGTAHPRRGPHKPNNNCDCLCFLRISIRFSNWIIGSLDASRAAATTDLCLIFLCKVASRDLTYR